MRNDKSILKYLKYTLIFIVVWVVFTLINEFWQCHMPLFRDPDLCRYFKTINEYTIKAIYKCIFD